MRKNRISRITAVAAGLLLAGAVFARENHRGDAPARTIYRRSRVAVPAPAPARVSSQRIEREQSRPAYPQHDERGAQIAQPAATVPPTHHATVVRNTAVVGGIQRQQRVEVEPHRYYWHAEHGVRYSHYYDGRDHWYGFYHGPTFYWTRYSGDRWWWYDGGAARWVYWSNGFWWWPGPGGAAYVYVDNNYYPYEGSGVTVVHEENQAPPSAVPDAGKGTTVVSPEGSRMAQIFGEEKQAFLYDKKTAPPTFLRYMGQGVTKVRFSGGTPDAPLKVLVEYKDDTFALFDANGASLGADVKAAETGSAPPPEAPTSIPPPPTAAPGQ
jgi:hypothetical protein